MYKIDRRNIKKGRLFHIIFLSLGSLFLVVILVVIFFASISMKSVKDYDTSVLADEIEIVEVRSHSYDRETGYESEHITYSPKYHFKYKGELYTCNSTSSSSFVDTSKKLVYFDSDNPQNCLTEYDASSKPMMLIFLVLMLLLPAIFITIGIIGFLKMKKRLDKYTHLENNGVLYKNLPYRMEHTGISMNHVPIMKLVVDFTLPNGLTVVLYGDPRFDYKTADADGMVDVLIDLNNPENYFVDFNIEEKNGLL